MATNKGGSTWWLPLVLAVFSLGVSAYTGYNRTDRDLVQRLTTVEVKVETTNPRLERIENKVDRLDDKVDKVLAIVVKELQ